MGAPEALARRRVRYDQFPHGRFRHGTKFLRWRPDRLPKQCTLDQVERRQKASVPSVDATEAKRQIRSGQG
jgi:ATP-dependent DNA ligase